MKRTSALWAYAAVSSALLSATPVAAQRSGVAKGAGLESCEQVLATMKEDHVDTVYTQWVAGYLSGYNLFGEQKQVEEIPDDAKTDAFLQKYCHANPLDKVIWASMSLISELGGYRPPYMKK